MVNILRNIFSYNEIIDMTQKFFHSHNDLKDISSIYEEIRDYHDGRSDLISEGRIFASRQSFENCDLGFAAKRCVSSYSSTLPLDKTRILYKQKRSSIDQII
jgi:hypothetical protein